MDYEFYKGRKILITGHTGFKGTWMCEVLSLLGAEVVGYALEPPTNPSLFALLKTEKRITSIIGDIRDLEHINKVFDDYQPEIVFHMAAQPIVRTGYDEPVYTYETNVMGTVNVLEAVRLHRCVKSVVNITTDKVYKNKEWEWGYRENDELDGFDPYSNSKSCSELVTSSYIKSFFNDKGVAVSTCRAGNVIGGGDFAKDRIIPDCIRAQINKKEINVRNPYSIRPYQHVLEPIFIYLEIAQAQYFNKERYSGSYNVGPNEDDSISTGELVDLFCEYWKEGATWKDVSQVKGPHEAGLLKLDCAKIKKVFNWKSVLSIKDAIRLTVDFGKVYICNGDMIKEIQDEIRLYMEMKKRK